MADDKPNTPNQRRRRPAPTIDLSATEVKSAEPPPQSTDESPPQSTDEKMGVPPSSSARSKWPVVFAIIAGGIGGAAAVVAWLWLGGSLRPDTRLSQRVAAIEAQQQAAPKADNRPLADLTGRIGKLEQAALKPAASDPAFADRLAAIENTMKTFGITLTALNRRAEESAMAASAARERADAAARATEALQTKLDAIEQSAKVTQDKAARNTGSDMAARRALATEALRDAVTRGAPYNEELATVKQLGADAQSIAPLEPLAAGGIPTEAGLSHEMRALLPSMVKAVGADASKADGFFERLQANAGKLVRIRPVGEPAGDTAPAVLARIEVKTTRNDLAGVTAELDKLPANVRAPADAWRKKLAARNAALAASRKLAAASAAALGSP